MNEIQRPRSTPRKSTNVLIMALLRAASGLFFSLAPRRAEAWAARQFCTPRRRGSGREPEVDGHPVERRTRRVGTSEIVSWTWGSGPDVLLVHGWEGRATQFKEIAVLLVGTGYRVTAVDLPAHGASSGQTTTVVDFAKTVRAIAAESSGVHAVIAHSLGATATTIALIDEPFARQAVLLAPAVEARHFAVQAAAQLGVPDANVGGMERAIEALAGRALDEIDLGRRAGALELPLLVLHDADDREVPLEQGEAVARVSRCGHLERLSGLGHRRILRDPAVAERILKFIRPEDEALERKVS